MLGDYNMSPADYAHITALLAEYHYLAPQEAMDRHLANIAREREQEAAQEQQDDTRLSDGR